MEGIKSRLMPLVEHTRSMEQKLVKELGAEERTVIASPECWSAKALLAHIVGWKALLYERLEAWQRGETPPNVDDYHTINAEILEQQEARPWDDVLEEEARVFADLTRLVQSADDQQLEQPAPWSREPRLIWDSIMVDSVVHPFTHMAAFYLERGDKEHALQMQRELMTRLDAFEGTRWPANGRYNVACILALAGEADQALGFLAEALRKDPELVEWSKEDSDLESLRGLPAYQALYSA